MNIPVLIVVLILVAVIVGIVIYNCRTKVAIPLYTVELYEIFNNNQNLITMSIEISLSQSKRIKVVVKDAGGNETTVAPGTSKFTLDDPTLATLKPVEGSELEVDVFPGPDGKIGVTQFNWEANGNNDGVGPDIPLSAFTALVVKSGDATQVEIVAGEAQQI